MDITEPNLPEKGGHEYRLYLNHYQTNHSSNKSTSVPVVTVTSKDTKDHKHFMVNDSEDDEVHLSISMQN